MLVLTRRRDQSIVIDGGIVVTVLEVKGEQVRLGVTAPREVQVFREELLAADRRPLHPAGGASRAGPGPVPGQAEPPTAETAPTAAAGPGDADAPPL